MIIDNLHNTSKLVNKISRNSHFAENKFNITNVINSNDYSIDKDGFLTESFNNIAGLPRDIKIHSNTLKQISEYLKNTKESLSVKEAVNKAWVFFNKIIGNSYPEKIKFSMQDLAKFPKGFTYNGTIFDTNVKIHYSQDENRIANKIENYIMSISDGNLSTGYKSLFTLGFGLPASNNKQNYDVFMQYLQNSFTKITQTKTENSEKISISELFALFIDKEIKSNPYGKKDEVRELKTLSQNNMSITSYLDNKFGQGYIEKLKIAYSKNMIDKLKSNAKFDEILKEIEIFIKTNKKTSLFPKSNINYYKV